MMNQGAMAAGPPLPGAGAATVGNLLGGKPFHSGPLPTLRLSMGRGLHSPTSQLNRSRFA